MVPNQGCKGNAEDVQTAGVASVSMMRCACLNNPSAIANMLYCISFYPLWLPYNFQIAFGFLVSHVLTKTLKLQLLLMSPLTEFLSCKKCIILFIKIKFKKKNYLININSMQYKKIAEWMRWLYDEVVIIMTLFQELVIFLKNHTNVFIK